MTKEEMTKFVEDAIREATDKMQGANLNNPSTLAALSTQAERVLGDLRKQGRIAAGSVTRVLSFEQLSIENRARLLAKYEEMRTANACFPDTFRMVLSDEEYRWLIREEWDAPAAVKEDLKARSSAGGLVDWGTYYDLLGQHPEAFLVAYVEYPKGKVLVDFNITPAYPINYIKLDITIGEEE